MKERDKRERRKEVRGGRKKRRKEVRGGRKKRRKKEQVYIIISGKERRGG